MSRRAVARMIPSGDPVGISVRTLPHDLAAERSVLGAILLHNDSYTRIAPILAASDFYRHAHQQIYGAMARLLERVKGAVDFVVLQDELRRVGELDECGGPGYISALVDGIPRSMHVDHYARIVQEKSKLRALIQFGNRLVSEAYEAEQGAADLFNRADRDLVELQGNSGHSLALLGTGTQRMFTDLEYRVAHKGQVTGVETGFPSINDLTMGWQPGDVVIIAARPSIGKSTFAVNTAIAGARSGARVAYFSPEMKQTQLQYRMLSSLTNIALSRILGGYVTDPEWAKVAAALQEMADLQIAIDDTPSPSVWHVRTNCRRMRAEGGLDLVIVDYVQLMPGTLDRKGATRNEEITDISRKIKMLAGELEVPVLLLSQLNRGAEGRSDMRPRLSDLRESGALEQDADLVTFLHRKNHREGGLTNFIIEKQRNGSTGTVNLTLDRDITLFTDGPNGADAPAEPEPTVEEKKERRQKHFQRRVHAQ